MSGDDWVGVIGIVSIILIMLFILFVEIVAVVIVAGAIASWLGVSGILWWAVAIVLFLLINGIIVTLGRL